MTRVVVNAVLTTLFGGVVAFAVVVAMPERRELVLDVYLLFVAGVILAALVRATRAAVGPHRRSLFETALRRRRPDGDRVAQLVRLEASVLLATETAGDFHYRLRPVLREIADHRLRTRRAIGLDVDPSGAREALGADAWDLLRADRAPPADRLAGGVPADHLRGLVDALERL